MLVTALIHTFETLLYTEIQIEINFMSNTMHPVGIGFLCSVFLKLTCVQWRKTGYLQLWRGEGLLQCDGSHQRKRWARWDPSVFRLGLICGCCVWALCVFTDRYVIYGNHRDSWVHGAIDPSSGTAVMLELSRVLGRMVKRGTQIS